MSTGKQQSNDVCPVKARELLETPLALHTQLHNSAHLTHH